jgi:hypothetical protein
MKNFIKRIGVLGGVRLKQVQMEGGVYPSCVDEVYPSLDGSRLYFGQRKILQSRLVHIEVVSREKTSLFHFVDGCYSVVFNASQSPAQARRLHY